MDTYTYKDLKTGLYCKYHYQPVSSCVFVPIGGTSSPENQITFCDIINWIVDADIALKTIKNPKIRQTLIMQAIGYPSWEIADMVGISERTIKRYIVRVKKLLK